jgi:glycerate kinase
MRIVVCPDKFRGTSTAAQVAAAISTGWRRARPDDDVIVLAMADGGEGTLDALVHGPELRSRRVTGPLGDPVEAAWGLRHDRTAVVEMATAAGLALLLPERRDPRRTTTRGVGELLGAAAEHDARRVLVCLGGSATNDGGTGMASALGVRFLDAGGQALSDGGAALARLARIDLTALHPRLASIEITGLVDVDNPLTGPSGASATYGPQKGADPETVWELDRALEHLAAVVERDLGVDPSREPGAGAAGGLGFGLLAFAGARLRPGVEAVADAVGLEPALATADLVVTGEGAFDATSLRGKVVGGVLRAADVARVPTLVITGRASGAPPEGVRLLTLVAEVGEDAAMQDTRLSLETVAERAAAAVVPR